MSQPVDQYNLTEQQVNAAISKVTSNDIEAEKIAREQAIKAKESVSDVGEHPVTGTSINQTINANTDTPQYHVNTSSQTALAADADRQQAKDRLAADVKEVQNVATRVAVDTQTYLADTAKIAQAQATETAEALKKQAQQAGQAVTATAQVAQDQAVATVEAAKQQAAQAAQTVQDTAVAAKDQAAAAMEAARLQAAQAAQTVQDTAVAAKDYLAEKASEAQVTLAQTAEAAKQQATQAAQTVQTTAVAAKDVIVDTTNQAVEVAKQQTIDTVVAAADIANATGQYMGNKLEEAKIATAESLVQAADAVLGDTQARVVVASAPSATVHTTATTITPVTGVHLDANTPIPPPHTQAPM